MIGFKYMEDITQTQFEEYERIREEGITNMYNLSHVVEMSGETLTREDCKAIMENYEELCIKYSTI